MKDEKDIQLPADIGQRQFIAADTGLNKPKLPTFQEVTDRIKSLASAMAALENSNHVILRGSINENNETEIQKAIKSIAIELSKITKQD